MIRFRSRTAVRVAVLVCAALPCCFVPLVRTAEKEPVVQFRDVRGSAGITFQHDNAGSPEKYLIETMGGGAAWLDYDNDGYVDLYLVNSAATKVYQPSRPLSSALYRNNGDGTFGDVTEKAAVGAERLFGMGVAGGDYDNDGFTDLYVIGYGRSILYHNNGNGTFTDVTQRAKSRIRQMGIERRLVRLRSRQPVGPRHCELSRFHSRKKPDLRR